MTRLPGLDASTGSLGQGLAIGVGIAMGLRRRGLGSQTWVLLGDGEMQEGQVWESIPVAAKYGLGNLTAIVDRNGMQQYGWPLLPGETHRGDRRDPFGGAAVRQAFEAFGWRVIEIDGHDFGAILAACEEARAAGAGGVPTAILAADGEGPRAELHRRRLRVAQQGGDGRRRRGGPGGARGGGGMSRAQRDVWADTLVDLAAGNPDILVLDGDLATSTRADRFAKAYPDRFLQMGIAEQGMVGAAVGLASMGYVPWLSSFAVFFSHRAVDQVRMAMAQTHANVKIAAAYAGLQTGFSGKTHLDVQDLAIMRAMPGLTVLAPADETECAAMVRWATATPGPVYLRLGREGGPGRVRAGIPASSRGPCSGCAMATTSCSWRPASRRRAVSRPLISWPRMASMRACSTSPASSRSMLLRSPARRPGCRSSSRRRSTPSSVAWVGWSRRS